MNSADSFSTDYSAARSKFREAASAAGAVLQELAHPLRGPGGEQLATDVAWIGRRDADRVLVMISATHGVEGFCGSGAQVDWLRRGEASRLAPDAAALLIHAINPYGFAWLRRVTEDNVDLNRNWVDFERPLPRNPGYDALSRRHLPGRLERGGAEAGRRPTWRRSPGGRDFRRLQQAVSGGQYHHPAGVFYGGDPRRAGRAAHRAAIFHEWLAGRAKVAVIDYHTGLGPWGYGEQIVTARRGTAAFGRAARWWGGGPHLPRRRELDLLGHRRRRPAAAPGLLPHAEVTGMALEFGVAPVVETLDALRADAWLHAHGDIASAEGQAIKAQVRAVFYGDADDWKGMVAGQSLLATRQALAGLAEP